jgi:hypothetical protein
MQMELSWPINDRPKSRNAIYILTCYKCNIWDQRFDTKMTIGVRGGMFKGIEDGRMPPALQMGHP